MWLFYLAGLLGAESLSFYFPFWDVYSKIYDSTLDNDCTWISYYFPIIIILLLRSWILCACLSDPVGLPLWRPFFQRNGSPKIWMNCTFRWWGAGKEWESGLKVSCKDGPDQVLANPISWSILSLVDLAYLVLKVIFSHKFCLFGSSDAEDKATTEDGNL